MDNPVDQTASQTLLMSSSTFDQLAEALSSYSVAPTPDPVSLSCCCGREDCEHFLAWNSLRAKLEERLLLAARIGEALLEKHEAYVRAQNQRAQLARSKSSPSPSHGSLEKADGHLFRQVSDLRNHNEALRKKLDQALVNSDVLESTHRALLNELNDARSHITRLNASAARSAGWESRLSTLAMDNDDLRQELEHARRGEARATGLAERCARLQEECERLKAEMERLNDEKAEWNDEILRDARARLEGLLHSMGKGSGNTGHEMDDEMMKVLESLVANNEALKRAQAESQNLLAEAREEVRSLREEAQERRASEGASNTPDFHNDRDVSPSLPLVPPSWTPVSIQRMAQGSGHRHRHTSSITSLASPRPRPRETTPDSLSERLRSPLEIEVQLAEDDTKDDTLSQPQPCYPQFANRARDLEFHLHPETTERRDEANEKPKSPMRQLMLLTRSRGVQTDFQPSHPSPYVSQLYLAPSPSRPSSRNDPSAHSTSETSSSHLLDRGEKDADGRESMIVLLVGQLTAILKKLSQADVATITERLRRQHLNLTPSSITHVSRSTISGIVAELAQLRSHLRTVVQEGAQMQVTRDEWRALLNLMRSLVGEMASMRGKLNEFELDVESKVQNPAGSGSWIAPISKLFTTAEQGPVSPVIGLGLAQKLGRTQSARIPSGRTAPALAASATTVNVEFSGGGVRQQMTATPTPNLNEQRRGSQQSIPASVSTSQSVRDLFAGARPLASQVQKDAWIVLPRKSSRLFSTSSSSGSDVHSTIRRGGKRQRRMSRNLDAIVDNVNEIEEAGEYGDEHDERVAELEFGRTLRPRGLSDSSIHTSFMNSGGPEPSNPAPGAHSRPLGRQGAFPISIPLPDRNSVLQSLSHKVQSLAASVQGGALNSFRDRAQERQDTGRDVSPGRAHGTSTPRSPIVGLSTSSPREESHMSPPQGLWGRSNFHREL